MCYADLTRCRDLDTDPRFAALDLVAVGWLEPDHPFPQGSPDQTLAATLANYAPSYGVRMWMGAHRCGFCVRAGARPRAGIAEGFRNLFFQIPGEQGFFVVPELIAHYIAAHDYQPPQSFLEAVAWRPPLEPDALPPD